jgi:hypothetical protein
MIDSFVCLLGYSYSYSYSGMVWYGMVWSGILGWWV